MADTTRSDVDAVYGNRAMSDSDADTLVSIANRLADDVFGGRIRTLGEVEGNEKDFKTYVAAHLWALREGESQSDSQTGGSVSYTWSTPAEANESLRQTHWGRMALGYTRSGASISVELARRR